MDSNRELVDSNRHSMKGSQSNRITWYLILILLLGLGLRLFAFAGVVGSDDVYVANNAFSLLENGPSFPRDHYSGRIGLIYPLAAIFGVFGVGEWQLVAIPLFLGVLGIGVAFYLGTKFYDRRVGVIAAFLLAIYPLDIALATQLVPDLPLGVTTSVSFALYLRACEERASLWWAIAAGVVWGIAYLIKIEAAFLAPAFFAALLFRPQTWRQVAVVSLGVLFVLLLENAIYFAGTDTWFYRLHAIVTPKENAVAVSKAYSATQLWVYPKTWFVTFYKVGIYFYLLIAAILWTVSRRRSSETILLVWVMGFVIWLQFGGNPFSETYSVKSHLTRYLDTFAIPMSVLIAAFVVHAFTKCWIRRAVLVFTAASSLFFVGLSESRKAIGVDLGR